MCEDPNEIARQAEAEEVLHQEADFWRLWGPAPCDVCEEHATPCNLEHCAQCEQSDCRGYDASYAERNADTTDPEDER
jgi:hypothetical protein